MMSPSLTISGISSSASGSGEELCKLALAALFMPWLVWRRAPGVALMTGAFVGLGFALEENIDYYQGMG